MNSICVYCGSSDDIHPDYKDAGRQMGRLLAENSITLVYGGGKTGIMGALAEGALAAGGQVIGVIVESMNTPALAQGGLTRLEVTATIHQRKARMYELAEGYIALPGGFGTFDELFETITWGQIGIHQKPIGLLNVRGYFDPLTAVIDHAQREGFIFPEHRQLLCMADSPVRLLDAMQQHQHPVEAVRRWMRQ
ncbi:MAG: TIGR00730 family Rossman fold protein [Anaerolineae bacterium CG_4_9_14_3_um_filter_57_17]|nr:TIGR00730 family Rossman fold protein [bacterium]NCT20287.1 TIGR00730 family Rossman fold protein [bacterium]OIO84765.1 MAG: Rossman fold protein, TIGR00730 family [Anaerolineae bacterium CG2_30_57_67]PJB64699.1 MAG: TIGR00730 family Rossman fold protein [Anaerolineae bacterium CG_4_9_14_3_um_filter_57_17]